jgi:hypothetical protein
MVFHPASALTPLPPALRGRRRCSVYDARPTQCRTYPFWRESMLTPLDWEAEAARCEGVAAGRDAAALNKTEATVSAASAIALAMFEEVLYPPSQNLA